MNAALNLKVRMLIFIKLFYKRCFEKKLKIRIFEGMGFCAEHAAMVTAGEPKIEVKGG